MRLKLHIVFALLTLTFSSNAQNIIYWSGSSVNGNWDWGGGCTTSAGGNWFWSASEIGNRSRPDCYALFNKIYFNNDVNTIMNLNSLSDFNANQIVFINGTSDRIVNTDVTRSIYFQNNNDNCKIENYVPITTHTFNVDIFVKSGGNSMEINPVNGYLLFNNTIRNNSDNPINVFGAQQVTFSGDITGTPGVTINNTATVVYSGVSKTYFGTTIINNGTKLKISTNQVLGNIVLNGGTIQVDAGVTLTITGTYIATGGTIDNKGTIKFSGGSVTFPGSANVNNGVANTLTTLEAAASGIVTINSLLRATNAIIVSAGTLLLEGNDLRLNNAALNIAAGANFDSGGENQIINEGISSTISISGTFITRDAQGFVGSNTAIPSIIPNLDAGSTVEYGLNGNQVVQGSRSYFNLTFSNSGTKILSSAITNLNTITGTVIIKDAAIVDSGSYSFGDSNTNLTMTDDSRLIVSGARSVPDMIGTYSLSGGTIEFAGNSNSHTARSPRTYNNVVISGANVNGSTGNYTLNNGAVFTVKSGAFFTVSDQRIVSGGASAIINIDGTFVTKDIDGFSGSSATSISPNNTIINLGIDSTIEYAKTGDQTITPFSPAYSNLTLSGSGIKTTTATTINIGKDLNIEASQLTIKAAQTFMVINKVNNSGGTFIIENNGSLVQVNDASINTGNITYQRRSNSDRNTDYTYWSTPVSSSQTLSSLFPNTLDGMYYSYAVTPSSEDWKKETSATTMDVGKGYIVRGPEPNPPSPPSFPTTSFFGTPNNGTIKISDVFQNKSYLLGNPYPSALNADKFLAANSGVLDGTLYFWTHNTEINDRNNFTITDPVTGITSTTAGSGSYAYTSNDYASYNGVGGVAASGGTIPSGNITTAQGFFASSNTAITGANEIIFNNSMRVDNSSNIMNNTQFFKTISPKTKSASFEKHRIWLNLKNAQGAFKQILIGYIANATNEYDNRFDGESFDANEFVDFYSLNQDKNLVIQGRALPFHQNDEVPLGFRTTIEGAFTINIDQVDGVLTNQAVFIEDKLTNTMFDLKTGNYTFNTVAGTFNDRFILRYTNKTLGTTDSETLEKLVLVSNKNKQIKVNSAVETIDKVLVYDLLGRIIYKKEKVNSNEITITNLVSGQQTLMVKVILQNGNAISKKVIH